MYVCICTSTGSPFISTLELRPLNLSCILQTMRIISSSMLRQVNFELNKRCSEVFLMTPMTVWNSDLEKRQNYLVGVASELKGSSTSKKIEMKTREFPPNGDANSSSGICVLNEIEDLGINETRNSKMEQPHVLAIIPKTDNKDDISKVSNFDSMQKVILIPTNWEWVAFDLRLTTKDHKKCKSICSK
ncbi:hypothetical protein MKX03_036085 [Papaver bracteatum]|nr:hypothetical protein MKX03_036085 [Papaver bracteatum]